jgi:hypothetical protein
MDVWIGQGLARQHFGLARLGDKRRTERLVKTAAQILRHPAATLPTAMENWSELNGLYRLVASPKVTHAAVLEPHRRQVLARMRAGHDDGDGVVLLIHDTTELNYTHIQALHEQVGKIGSGQGSGRGYLAHHTLAVTPQRRVLGLLSQVLHCRRDVPKGETMAQTRRHPGRESRLWIKGCQACGPAPAGCTWIDIADRGSDTFEFLSYEQSHGRRYVIRSAKDRTLAGEDHLGDDRIHHYLHQYARDLPELGRRTLDVPAKAGKKARRAQVAIAAALVTLDAHRWTRGEHDGRAVEAWVIHVKEVGDPPAAGVKGSPPLEWILLSNLPAQTLGQACQLVDFYACRPVIEDYHKALKTGLGIEHLQFEHAERVEPAVALLSVVGALLLELREAARRRDADVTAATTLVPALFVRILSARLHGRTRDDLSVGEFVIGIARLGGFLARTGDGLPGWQTLWRGWQNLQLLVAGAQLLRGGP